MKKCFTILAAILLGFLVLLCLDLMLERAIQSAALDSDESSLARSEAADLQADPIRLPLTDLNLPDEPPSEEENEDLPEPPLTWAEAHCAPKHYKPPEALVPDRWHPANDLLNKKP